VGGGRSESDSTNVLCALCTCENKSGAFDSSASGLFLKGFLVAAAWQVLYSPLLRNKYEREREREEHDSQ